MTFPLDHLTINLTIISELPSISTEKVTDQNSNSNHVSKKSEVNQDCMV